MAEEEIDFSLKRYDSIDAVQLASFQVENVNLTLEELYKSTLGGIDENEQPIEFPYHLQKEGIELMGYWGWIDGDNVIHYWIDKNKNIPIEELIHFRKIESGKEKNGDLSSFSIPGKYFGSFE